MTVRSAIAVALAMMAALPVVAQNPAPAIVHLRTVKLVVRGHHHVEHFVVEVAQSPAEQERGLMYRTKIPHNTGMIFPMDPPHPVAFWMKNCPIPEDMIFVSPDGRIESIAHNTTPFSEQPVASGGSVKAVFEVAGGETNRLGIKPGDKVEWSAH